MEKCFWVQNFDWPPVTRFMFFSTQLWIFLPLPTLSNCSSIAFKWHSLSPCPPSLFSTGQEQRAPEASCSFIQGQEAWEAGGNHLPLDATQNFTPPHRNLWADISASSDGIFPDPNFDCHYNRHDCEPVVCGHSVACLSAGFLVTQFPHCSPATKDRPCPFWLPTPERSQCGHFSELGWWLLPSGL